jgi:hypothetical protein
MFKSALACCWVQAEDARAQGYTFPYLFDESQEVAKAYCAACTPEFYVSRGASQPLACLCTAASC